MAKSPDKKAASSDRPAQPTKPVVVAEMLTNSEIESLKRGAKERSAFFRKVFAQKAKP